MAAINRQLLLAAGLLVALVVILLILAGTISMAGAVIAQGQVAVLSNVKRIQHPTGGVVSEIHVHDGSHVRAGDVLLSLDATTPGANVAIVTDAVNELAAKKARLEAERDSRDAPRFDSAATGASAKAAEADETRLFRIHAQAHAGEKAQLKERVAQLKEQIHGLEEASKAKRTQIVLIDNELVGVRELFAKNLVPISRLNALERDAVQLQGEVAQLAASVAEAREKISETELQAIQVDETSRSEAGNQLGECRTSWRSCASARSPPSRTSSAWRSALRRAAWWTI